MLALFIFLKMGNFVVFAQLLTSLNRQEAKCGKGGSGPEGAWRENVVLDSDLMQKMSFISLPLDSLHVGNAKEPETFAPKSTLLSLIITLRRHSENKTVLYGAERDLWGIQGRARVQPTIPTLMLDVEDSDAGKVFG